jgi:hypothetical protein
MDKKKIMPITAIWKYVRELSVVVIGITITLSANNWINDRSERKNLDLYLNTVKLELEENLKIVDGKKDFYKRSFEYVVYLSSNEKTAIAQNQDSLKTYSDILHSIALFLYKSNAFDMLKSSGEMRLIKDKEMLQSIWGCYSDLETLKAFHELAMQQKLEDGKKEAENEKLTGIPVAIPMYEFFHDTDVHQAMKNGLDEMSDEIEQTLLQFK